MTKNDKLSSNSENEILINAPASGGEFSFNKIIKNAPENCLIRISKGEYLVTDTINFSKSIRLIGDGIDKTIITGSGVSLIVESSGNHKIEMEGISFIVKSKLPSTAVRINGGVLKVKACAFSGGVGGGDGKSGMGIFVGGKAEVEIRQSRFEENEESGMWLEGKTYGVLLKNEFKNNDSGFAVTGFARINALENNCMENHVGVAYDQYSKGLIEGNSFFDNRCGVLVKGNSSMSILNNKFAENDIGIALAERCNVEIKGNAIDDGDWGVKVINNAKALIENNTMQKSITAIGCLNNSNTKIYSNNLFRNTSLGIIARDDAITHIEANTISENEFGIEVNHDVNFRIENNKIIGNSRYGMYARRQARGIVHKNIIKKNGEGGVIFLDDTVVDFDNYEEPILPGYPVRYSEDNLLITISAPNKAERVTLKDLYKIIQPETEIVFAAGEYNLSDPIIIDKPIKLIAQTIGEVKLIGDGLPYLLIFEGQGKLCLKGIAFSLESQSQTNVVVMKSGDLEMDQCTIEGGKDPETSKRDFGAGLILLGSSTATVSHTIFKNNFLGISVQNESAVTLVLNKFTENAYGIVLRDKSNSHLRENEYFSNESYGLMAYDESELEILLDTCHNNKAGFGFMNHSKVTVREAKSFENEYHGFFIDNDADCVLLDNQGYSNEMSGIAIYGDSLSLMERNDLHENGKGGFEIAENAKSTLRNNKIHENDKGIFVGNNANVNIDMNEIYKNGSGISINDEADATINNNKIYQNSEASIEFNSEKNIITSNNELFDNCKENQLGESAADDDDNGGFDFGDLLAKMLGSENLSNDPNTIVIPIDSEMLGLGGKDIEEENKVENQEGDDEEGEEVNYRNGLAEIPFTCQYSGLLIQNRRSLVSLLKFAIDNGLFRRN